MAVDAKARSGGKLKKWYGGLDYGLLLAVAGLLIIGLMAVYSATFDWSYQEHQNSFREASRQFLWVTLGLVVMAVAARIPYDFWKRLAVPIMVLTLVLLILVLIIGKEVNGAKRTLFGGSVQPSEVAKLGLVVYLATWLASKGEQIRDVTYGLIPFAVLIGVVAGLIVIEPDVSTAVLIALTALAMFFFAGADIFQLVIGGTVSGLTFYLLVNQFAHAKERLDDWLMARENPELLGYHARQTRIALGSGGLFGVGLGRGEQKLGWLPAQHTDSIFAMLGEELGFVGCMLILSLFVLLAYRGFKIALKARDAFAALLACGITCFLTFQAAINIGVMTGLIPFTGMPLPFISAGGSGVIVALAAVGVLMSISQGNRLERRPKSGGFQRATLDRRWGNRGTRLSRSRRRTSSRR